MKRIAKLLLSPFRSPPAVGNSFPRAALGLESLGERCLPSGTPIGMDYSPVLESGGSAHVAALESPAANAASSIFTNRHPT